MEAETVLTVSAISQMTQERLFLFFSPTCALGLSFLSQRLLNYRLQPPMNDRVTFSCFILEKFEDGPHGAYTCPL